ncbi:radical SAM protein [Salmonella enterica]|nr:radical SAM protein [Salmonella enterica]
MEASEVFGQLYEQGAARSLKFVMTSRCNLGCSYCPQDHNPVSETPWNLKKMQSMLRAFVDSMGTDDKSIDFIGGEPLLRKRLIHDFLITEREYLIRNEVTIHLSTNGLLLDQETIDLLATFPNSAIFISLDTLAMGSHRPLQRQQFEHICKQLMYISGKMGKYNTTVVMSVGPQDVTFLEDSMKMLYKIGVGNFLVNPVFYNNYAKVDWTLQGFKDCERILMDFYNDRMDAMVTFGAEVAPKGSHNCLSGSLITNVDADGHIAGCFFFSGNKGEYFPDAHIGTIGEVNEVFHDRIDKSKRDYAAGMNNLICQSCDIQGLCSMCPAGHKKLNDGYFGPVSADGFMFCQQAVRSHITVRDYCQEYEDVRKYAIEEFAKLNNESE